MKYEIKLGFAPARRFIFSKEDALKFKVLTKEKLQQMGIDFVNYVKLTFMAQLHQ